MRESIEERENLREIREILKRKREGDFVWMDEMRERGEENHVSFCGFGMRESWEKRNLRRELRGKI